MTGNLHQFSAPCAGPKINCCQLLVALGLLVICGCQVARAAQFTLLDINYTHTTANMAFSFFPLAPGTPASWMGFPRNYAEGTVYLRLEVKSKPSARAVNYQICLFQDEHITAKHACSTFVSFTAPGIYERTQQLSSFWQYANIDWTRALLDQMLVVKSANGNPVDTRYGFGGTWDGSPDLSLYFPMQVHFTAVVVASGGVFEGWPTVSKAATPTLVPNGGTFNGPTNVALATSTAGAAIRYTLDGSEPSQGSRMYAGPITILDTTEVRARAFKLNMTNSDEGRATFTIRPVVLAQAPGGLVDRGVGYADVTFSTAINGSTFTSADVVVTTPSGALPTSQISATSLTPQMWRISFPIQVADGAYTVQVGPNIANTFGQTMAAAFTGHFTISFPRTLAVARSGTNLHLTWPTSTGLLYQLQSTADFATWGKIGAPTAGTGALFSTNLPIGPDANRLLRLQFLEN